jgi:hypothetical protein
MKSRAIFATIILCAATQATHARPIIYIEQGKGMLDGLLIQRTDGRRVVSSSLSSADLTLLVEEKSRALDCAKQAIRHNDTANIWFWSTYPTGLVMILAAFIVPQDNPGLGGGLLAGGIVVALGGLIPSAYYAAEAQRLNFLAINEYNGVYDLEVTPITKEPTGHWGLTLGAFRF